MKIEVTQDDIDEGIPSNRNKCPVSLAVNRVILKSYHTGSGPCDILIFSQKDNLLDIQASFKTPPRVADFIHRFDGRYCVKPFEFEIPIPEQYLAR